MRVLSIIGAVGAGILTLLGLPGMIVGIGLWKLEPWSRIGAMVIAVFNLMNIPFGTALSLYTFWVLLSNDCSKLFRSDGL